jgi:hypothetical protein
MVPGTSYGDHGLIHRHVLSHGQSAGFSFDNEVESRFSHQRSSAFIIGRRSRGSNSYDGRTVNGWDFGCP